LYVPLRVANRIRGVISVQSYQFDAYAETQGALLTAVANHVATALENAELFGETKEALAETQTLYEISARLNASANVQEALEAAAGPAIVEGAASASLLRVHVDDAGQPAALELTAVWPRSSQPQNGKDDALVQSIANVLGEWADNPFEPILVPDAEEDRRAGDLRAVLRLEDGVKAFALLPLRIGERWIGVLNFNWQEQHAFAPRDARLYRALMAQAATVLDNRALFEQTQNALARAEGALAQVQEAQGRLNLQYQTANILARTNSFQDAAPQILENTCRLLNWQIGEYWALDEDVDRLALAHMWHEDVTAIRKFAQDSAALTFAPGDGLVGRALAEGRPIWVPDVRDDAGFKQLRSAENAGLVSVLAFPLQSEAHKYGVTVFFSSHPQTMDETLMATMVGIASQIGQFLERRRAEEAMRQQNTYLTALHDTTLGLMRRLNVEELLQNIITRAAELVGTEHGYVHLIEPGGGELRMRVGIGVYQDFIGTRVKAGQGLAGTVWSDQKPIVVDDYRHWQGRLPMVDRDVLRAVAGVPLKSGAQTVGVLGLASLDEGRKFRTAQIEALNRFAELAAVALDNAQLYNATQNALEQTQRVAQREKASAEIADKLYAAPDVNSVLRTAAEELRKSTGSRRAVVRLNLRPDTAEPNGNTDDTESPSRR
jgi:GAF domain-containing protein